MWEHAGLVRDAESLAAAQAALERIDAGLDAVGVAGDPSMNTAWQDWLSVRNQTLAARLIASSAIARRESRGATTGATSRRRLRGAGHGARAPRRRGTERHHGVGGVHARPATGGHGAGGGRGRRLSDDR
jgi:hypothetical protein